MLAAVSYTHLDVYKRQAYRRSIAKDVLGTDDPTEVQAALSDWDKFNDVAEKAAAKGYKMLSGYDDSYRTFSNNVSAGWVDGTTVKVDPNIMNLSLIHICLPVSSKTAAAKAAYT